MAAFTIGMAMTAPIPIHLQPFALGFRAPPGALPAYNGWASAVCGVEVACVARRDRVALFDGRGTDCQIVKRDCNPFGRPLTAYASDDLAGFIRDRMHRNVTLHLFDKHPPALLPFWRIRPVDAMHQLGHGHRADGDLYFAFTLANLLQEIFHCLSLALRVDDHAGIED